MRNLTREDRIDMFRDLMHPYVSEKFLTWLIENGFFDAPASTKYHGSYPGGLFDHCYVVTKTLIGLTEDCDLSWWRAESPYLVGMFHDLCKIDCYQHPVIGHTADGKPIYDLDSWEYSKNMGLKGHGDKSIMLLSMHTTLTEEEIMCIRYHMGAFTDKEEWRDYTNAVKNFPNALWTHHADMLASHVSGV